MRARFRSSPASAAGAATPQAVDLLTLGGTVDLFAGVNAPQDIATLDPADPGDAKGLLVQDAQFGLALLNASVADQTYTVVHNGTSNTVTFDPPLPASQSVDSVTLEQSTLQGTKRVTLPAADIDLSPDGTVLTLTVPANAFDFTADDPVTAQVSFADSTTYYAGTINTGTVTAVGLEGIALSGSAQLQFNQSSGTDGGYIDFTADPTALTNPLDTDADNAGLRISTGVSVEQFVDLNFNDRRVPAGGRRHDGHGGRLRLRQRFAGLGEEGCGHGFGQAQRRRCAATPQAVDLLTLGGTVDLFAGVNAPQDIATLDPADPGATKGLLVQDAQFGLALLNASVADQTYTVVHNGTSNTVTFDPPLPASQSVDSVTLEQSTLQGTKRVTLPAADIDLSPDGTVLTLTVPANAFDFTADDPVTAQVSFADSTTYYAGTINTGTVTAVGLEGIALSGSAQLQFNQSSGTDGGYIDFTADPTALTNPLDTDADNAGLRISTGVSVEQFVDLNFNTEFLRVAGDLKVEVDGFVYADGSLAFEKGATGNVTVKDSNGLATTQRVDLLTIGGTADLFAGINAPQDIATLNPTDPGATKGLLVEDAQFGLALLNASVADQTYTVEHSGTSNTVTLDAALPASQSVDSVTLEQSTLQGIKRVTLPAGAFTLSGTVLTLTVPANAFDFTADPVTAQVSFADATTYYAVSVGTGLVTAVGIPGVKVNGTVEFEINESNAAGNSYIDFGSVPTIEPLDNDPANAGLRISTGVQTTEFVDFNYNSKFLRVGLAGELSFGGTELNPLVQIDASFDQPNLPVSTSSTAPQVTIIEPLGVGQALRSVTLKSDANGSLLLDGDSYTLSGNTITIDQLPENHGFDFQGGSVKADVGIAGTTIDFTKSVTETGTEIEIIAGTQADELSATVDVNGTPLGASGSLHMKFNDTQTTLISASFTAQDRFVLKESGTDYLILENPGVTLNNLTVSGGSGDVLGITETFPNPSAPDSISLNSKIAVHDIKRGDVVSVILRDAEGNHLILDPDSDPAQYTVDAEEDSITLAVAADDVSDFDLDHLLVDVTFAPKIGLRASTVSLFPDNDKFMVTVDDSDDADPWAIQGNFNLATADFRLVVDTFALDVTVPTPGVSLAFNAENVVIDTTDDIIAQFDLLDATVGVNGLTIAGSGENFGITKSGGLATFGEERPFAVSLSVTGTTGAQLGIPSWLDVGLEYLQLKWDDFSEQPEDFTMVVSAYVTAIGPAGSRANGLSFTGGFTGLVIRPTLLQQGLFPITDIGSGYIGVKGALFGGQIDAGLILGVAKLRADGSVIAETDPDQNVDQRVLYGGIEGGFSMPGVGGVTIRLGMSEFGPLSAYIESHVPIVIDPQSGLTIDNLRGGVQFASTLPTPADAFALRGNEYKSQSGQTAAEWKAAMIQSVATLATDGETHSFGNVLNQTMLISAGATLYSSYTSQYVFRADADLTFDTSGKILINAKAVYGDTLDAQTYFFGDLTEIQQGQGQFLFLVDVPGGMKNPDNTLKNPISNPVFSVYGDMSFQVDSLPAVQNNNETLDVSVSDHLTLSHSVYNPNTITVTLDGAPTTDYTIDYGSRTLTYLGDGTGTLAVTYESIPEAINDGFQIVINGGASVDMAYGLYAKLEGRLTLDVTDTEFTARVAAHLDVSYLGAIGDAGGTLVIAEDDNGLPQVWGALEVRTGDGLAKLQTLGIDLDGTAELKINTTDIQKQVAVTYLKPDASYPFDDSEFTDPEVVTLKESSFSIFVDSNATFRVPGTNTEVFSVDGQFFMEISDDRVDMVAHGEAALAADTLVFQIDGVMQISDAGLAARMLLTADENTSTIPLMSMGGAFGFYINTTGSEQTILLPDDFTAPLDGVNPRNAGPDDVRTVSISRGAPQFPAGFVAGQPLSYDNLTFDANDTNYFVVMGSGDLTVADLFVLDGSFRMAATANLQNPYLSMQIIASMNLFSANIGFEGNAEIHYGSNPGLVFDASANASIGIAPVFTASANFDVNFDTRGTLPTTEIALTNLNLSLVSVLEFDGSGYIRVDGGFLRLGFDTDVDFFGLATIDADGWFQSDGQFFVHVGGDLTLGGGGTGLFGSVDFNAGYDLSEVSLGADISGSAKLFGVSVASVDADVTYSSGSGKINAAVTVEVVGVEKTKDFTVGYLKIDPPPPYRPATLETDGTLNLNIGARASQRSSGAGSADLTIDGNQYYTVKHIGWVDEDDHSQGEVVRVYGNGRVDSGLPRGEYRGVKRIVGVGAVGNDIINMTGVQSPAELTSGALASILIGGDGGNTLTGGPGNDELVGGNGTNILNGRGGRDILTGGSGQTTFVFGEGFATLPGADATSAAKEYVNTTGTAVLDFSGLTSNLVGTTITSTGGTFSASDANELADRSLLDVSGAITQILLGSGNDQLDLPDSAGVSLAISNAGGSDSYQFATGQGVLASDINVTSLGSGTESLSIEKSASTSPVELNHHQLISGSQTFNYDGGVTDITLLANGAQVSGSTITNYGDSVNFTTSDSGNTADLDDLRLHVVATAVTMQPELHVGGLTVEANGAVTFAQPIRAINNGDVRVETIGVGAGIDLFGDVTSSSGDNSDGLGSGTIRLVALDGNARIDDTTFRAANGRLALGALGLTNTVNSTVNEFAAITTGTGAFGNITVRETDSLTIVGEDLTPNNVADVTGIVSTSGMIDVQLDAASSLLTLQSADLRTLATDKDITLTADEMDFLSGANQLSGTGDLNIRAKSNPWTYAFGTAAEDSNQIPVDAASTLDLGTRDLAALQDGFGHLYFGRPEAGNHLDFGHTVLRDDVTFEADSVRIRGEVEATTSTSNANGDRFEVFANTLTVDTKHLHTLEGSPDSGISARSIFLDIRDRTEINGWLARPPELKCKREVISLPKASAWETLENWTRIFPVQ